MTTPRKCWPTEAEWARIDSVNNARQIQAMCSTARVHIGQGNKFAIEATVNRIETLAVSIERDLLSAKRGDNGRG